MQDQEHRRIARELHDSLGQELVAAKMAVDGILLHNPADSMSTGRRCSRIVRVDGREICPIDWCETLVMELTVWERWRPCQTAASSQKLPFSPIAPSTIMEKKWKAEYRNCRIPPTLLPKKVIADQALQPELCGGLRCRGQHVR
jgi:hypothetical protein